MVYLTIGLKKSKFDMPRKKHTKEEAAVGNCERRGQPCHFIIVGFSWTQVDHHVYKRYILRRCIRCGDKNAETVHWIYPEHPICLNCFSQRFVETKDTTRYRCSNCGSEDTLLMKEQIDGSV